ncbi:MAG: ParA family protein [Methylobacillus sp.]|jgi:chromosome partitioning protein|nr:ParA family protein [Methylobacillus sp.]
MRTVLIANPKGGSGKTTLATHLAGYFATRGRRVTLVDLDRQQSSLAWLHRRPDYLPLIQGVDGRKHKPADSGAEWVIMDSPAGLHDDKLTSAIKQADAIIVPMQPSAFDLAATEDFLNVLREEKAIRRGNVAVALVGMRARALTNSAATLEEYLNHVKDFDAPTTLRDAQVYMLTAEMGASLFDIRPSQVERDLEQWAPLLRWLTKSLKNG